MRALLAGRSILQCAWAVRVCVCACVGGGGGGDQQELPVSTTVSIMLTAACPSPCCLLCCQVFKHHHEETTGRTSSIGQHNLCLDSKGQILNDQQFRNTTCGEYVKQASKVVTLVDLAGQSVVTPWHKQLD